MLLSYLKRHYKLIIMLAVFACVFAAVFSLYDLPAEAVLYSCLLCFVLGCGFFAFGYARYAVKLRRLRRMLPSVAVTLDALPAPSGGDDEAYQELLRALFAEKSRIESAADLSRGDMMDYCTLWAHQIKTPISAMRLLLSEEPSPHSAELEAELFKTEQYVETVLNYMKLDGGFTDYVLREYELDDIIRQAVRKYARLFIIKKLPLDFRETGMRAVTDEKWLSFVIGQILSNSLKYTYVGSISIYGGCGCIVIEDTGIGISGEDLPRIGERGFTGYNGHTDKKSTGVGLYLCRRILRGLGHTISFESEAGRGTKVIIGF